MGGWHCCVPVCTNNSKRLKNLSWHSFPQDKHLKKQWLIKIRRDIGENFQISSATKVCSDHFKSSDFKPLLHTRKKILKPGSVPSVFKWSNGKQDNKRQERMIKRHAGILKSKENVVDPHQEIGNQVHLSQSNIPIVSDQAIIHEPTASDNFPQNLSMDEVHLSQTNRPIVSDQNNVVFNLHASTASENFPQTLSMDKVPELSTLEITAAQCLLSLQSHGTDSGTDCDTLLESMSNIPSTAASQKSDDIEKENRLLKEQVKALQTNNIHLSKLAMRNEKLIARLKKKEFSLSCISKNPDVFTLYTGFPTYETFVYVTKYLKGKATRMHYWRGTATVNTECSQTKKTRNVRQFDVEEEFFLVLLRLRQGTPLVELARLFGISEASVSLIFTTWINFLFNEFRQMFLLPSREVIKHTCPPSFKEFPKTTLIIDCTEIRIQRPSSIQRQKETFSTYKHYTTCKCLIGVTPGGLVTFVSKLYGGASSDKHITKRSGLYDLLRPGDQLMADKGFEIQDDLPLGVTLNVPPKFMKKSNPQMPVTDVLTTRKIAKVRVHVERAIRRMKVYNIISGTIPLSMAKISDQIVAVCAFLTNFQNPLINTA